MKLQQFFVKLCERFEFSLVKTLGDLVVEQSELYPRNHKHSDMLTKERSHLAIVADHSLPVSLQLFS